LPTIPNEIGEISVPTLLTSVNQVGFAAYKDETLPMLTGINLSCKSKNSILFTATDKSRLAIKAVSFKGNVENAKSALVKASILLEMAKAFDEDETVKIHIDKDKPEIISFSTLKKLTTALLIDRTYPEVESVIPKDNEITAQFNKEKLLNASKGISVVAGREATMHLHLEKSHATIQTSSSTEESSGVEVVDVKYSGAQNLDIYFIPSYFTEGLNAITTDDVVIKFNDEKTPVAFYEFQNGKISKEFVYVLVPFVK
jgi:DNA polymerase-3 subunit beta